MCWIRSLKRSSPKSGAILTTVVEAFKEEGVTTIDRPGYQSQPRQALDLEVTAHRHRDPNIRAYAPVSEYVSNEVSERPRALCLPRTRDRHLRTRESLSDLPRPA